jgi:hypothetical protein
MLYNGYVVLDYIYDVCYIGEIYTVYVNLLDFGTTISGQSFQLLLVVPEEKKMCKHLIINDQIMYYDFVTNQCILF